MKVQIDKSYPMPSSPEAAWALLQDLEQVAGCMPGARITERLGPSHFKGTVTVKLGPASLAFRGEVEASEVDEVHRSLRLAGRGTDSTGTSGAALELHAQIQPDGLVGCRLVGQAEVSVSGKAATFGGRLMSGVADQVLQQFAGNFARRLPVPAVGEAAVAQGEAPADGAASAGVTATSGAYAAASASASASASPTAPVAPAEPAARELDGLGVLWGMVRDWVAHLFGARRA